jgi:hypothetical protein
MKIFQENEGVDLKLVMFSQNRNQQISVEFRGCFPHAEVLIENTNVISNLSPLFNERCSYNAMIEFVTIRKLKG